MLQEKPARTPYTLRVEGGCRTYVALYARLHAVRTYISFSSSDIMLAVCTAVRNTAFSSFDMESGSTARHSSTAQTMFLSSH